VRIPKRIFTRHHSDSNYAVDSTSIRLFRARIFDRLCNRLATKIVAVSPLVRELLIVQENVSPLKVRTINTSVPNMPDSRLLKVTQDNPFTIGVMSRLTEIKGVEYVAEAFSNFCKLYPDSRLVIVGEKSDSTEVILQRLTDVPKDKITFIRKTNDIISFYSSLDAFVHVPIRENAEAFGLVYLEALFSKVPCIFTESGILKGNEELKSLCTIVDYKNATQIQKSLERIYRGEAGIKNLLPSTLSQFSPESMINSYSELWRD
jgi:glycosyltransferase involved in cell wall biosynthesis